jgi:hypothetical protein
MKKYTKWVSRSILISIFSIAVVLIFTLDTTTTEVVREIRPGYILAALVIHLFSFVIWGLRIKSMTSALGHKVGLFRSFEIVVSGTFAAAMTPSSIGGEPLRIHLLRQDQIPIGKATAVILGERILDAILMLLAAPFSIYLFHGILSDPRINVVVILGGLLSVISLIIMFYALLRPRYVKLAINSLVAWMIKRFSCKKIGEKLYRFSESIDTEIDEFHESMYIFCTEGRVGLFYGIVYTIIYWIVDFSSLPVILLGLNQPPSVLICIAAQVLLLIIIVVPLTPGSSGVAEFAAISIFSAFMPVSILGIVVATWRAFTFYTNILVGGFVSFKLLKDTELVQKYLKRS